MLSFSLYCLPSKDMCHACSVEMCHPKSRCGNLKPDLKLDLLEAATYLCATKLGSAFVAVLPPRFCNIWKKFVKEKWGSTPLQRGRKDWYHFCSESRIAPRFPVTNYCRGIMTMKSLKTCTNRLSGNPGFYKTSNRSSVVLSSQARRRKFQIGRNCSVTDTNHVMLDPNPALLNMSKRTTFCECSESMPSWLWSYLSCSGSKYKVTAYLRSHALLVSSTWSNVCTKNEALPFNKTTHASNRDCTVYGDSLFFCSCYYYSSKCN